MVGFAENPAVGILTQSNADKSTLPLFFKLAAISSAPAFSGGRGKATNVETGIKKGYKNQEQTQSYGRRVRIKIPFLTQLQHCMV